MWTGLVKGWTCVGGDWLGVASFMSMHALHLFLGVFFALVTNSFYFCFPSATSRLIVGLLIKNNTDALCVEWVKPDVWKERNRGENALHRFSRWMCPNWIFLFVLATKIPGLASAHVSFLFPNIRLEQFIKKKKKHTGWRSMIKTGTVRGNNSECIHVQVCRHPNNTFFSLY